METETKVCVFISFLFLVLIGSVLTEGQFKRLDRQACVTTMKDRPAAEILAVCK